MSKKGQASTEYLITFAAIIAFSVALISLVSYYSTNSIDVQEKTSFNYWASLQPFSVIEWNQKPNGTLTIYMKNVGLNTMVFYNITIDGKTIGKKTRVPINNYFEIKGDLDSCKQGELVSYYNVTLRYNIIGNSSTISKRGAVPIIIICG